ncbi:MAG: helix-turn-helix-type transcriptional regulator [Flammeovirgaceae bacterium]|nr:helix-turn-helix-type transcriptional regulator [Flammeovirgaceae bacterium]MBE61435.1 helix-turn-helix-type transcriptional regulator [Flammeovirgaceae bacterium]MBR11076.1 helix-turn-helix-type transcriptional regulator [Rickettsiales bacterium]|tara:strand:- start:10537 stop:11436 length:900 start_codon:yes stop_codon:yes gene_type:complete
MSTFSIRDLEHLSGIKAHTIRIWEQRYELIQPKRTDTNIRFYDDQDLKLILNVALLKENGVKISKIAEMTEGEMQREVIKLTERNLRYPEQIHSLTIAMVDLDEERFEKIISSNILKLGFEKTMINIIYPFLSKIGILWQTGAINPAQEHFISNLVRQKLIAAIDGQYFVSNEKARKYILYLPEGELHELSLLFADYIIKSRNNRTVYLGQSLPFMDLSAVYDIHQSDYILSVITTTPGPSEIQAYVDRLAASFPNAHILLTGFQVVGQDVEAPDNVTIFTRLDQLIQFVEENTMSVAS